MIKQIKITNKRIVRGFLVVPRTQAIPVLIPQYRALFFKSPNVHVFKCRGGLHAFCGTRPQNKLGFQHCIPSEGVLCSPKSETCICEEEVTKLHLSYSEVFFWPNFCSQYGDGKFLTAFITAG